MWILIPSCTPFLLLLQRSNLSMTVLTMKAMGINDLLNFDFMDPPPPQVGSCCCWILILLLHHIYMFRTETPTCPTLISRTGRRRRRWVGVDVAELDYSVLPQPHSLKALRCCACCRIRRGRRPAAAATRAPAAATPAPAAAAPVPVVKVDPACVPLDYLQTLISALEQLYNLGALDEEGLLTRLGRKMAEFPLDPPVRHCCCCCCCCGTAGGRVPAGPARQALLLLLWYCGWQRGLRSSHRVRDLGLVGGRRCTPYAGCACHVPPLPPSQALRLMRRPRPCLPAARL